MRGQQSTYKSRYSRRNRPVGDPGISVRNAPVVTSGEYQQLESLMCNDFGYGLSQKITPGYVANVLSSADTGSCRDQASLISMIQDRDAVVSSHLQTRKLAAAGIGWNIIGGPSEKRQEMEDSLVSAGIEALKLKLLDGIPYGYAGARIVWGAGGDTIIKFSSVAQENWEFDQAGNPAIAIDGVVTGLNNEHRYAYVLHTPQIKPGIPSQQGVLRPVTWIYLFKNYAIKFKTRFLEKFGIPFIVEKVSESDFNDDDVRAKLKNELQNIGANGVGLTTADSDIQFPSVAAQGNNGNFVEWINKLDEYLALTILGQIATAGPAGGFSQGQAQENVRQDIVRADALALQDTINNQIVKPFEYYKWGTSEMSFKMDVEPPKNLKDLVGVIDLIRKMGHEVDADYIEEISGVPLKKDAAGKAVKPTIDAGGGSPGSDVVDLLGGSPPPSPSTPPSSVPSGQGEPPPIDLQMSDLSAKKKRNGLISFADTGKIVDLINSSRLPRDVRSRLAGATSLSALGDAIKAEVRRIADGEENEEYIDVVDNLQALAERLNSLPVDETPPASEEVEEDTAPDDAPSFDLITDPTPEESAEMAEAKLQIVEGEEKRLADQAEKIKEAYVENLKDGKVDPESDPILRDSLRRHVEQVKKYQKAVGSDDAFTEREKEYLGGKRKEEFTSEVKRLHSKIRERAFQKAAANPRSARLTKDDIEEVAEYVTDTTPAEVLDKVGPNYIKQQIQNDNQDIVKKHGEALRLAGDYFTEHVRGDADRSALTDIAGKIRELPEDEQNVFAGALRGIYDSHKEFYESQAGDRGVGGDLVAGWGDITSTLDRLFNRPLKGQKNVSKTMLAIQKDNLKYLIKRGIDVDKNKKELSKVDKLLERQDDINFNDRLEASADQLREEAEANLPDNYLESMFHQAIRTSVPMAVGMAMNMVPIVGQGASFMMWQAISYDGVKQNMEARGVDPNTASQLALISSIPIAAAEHLLVKKLTPDALKRLSGQITKNVGKSLADFAKEKLKDYGREVATELVQNTIEQGMDIAAQKMTDEDVSWTGEVGKWVNSAIDMSVVMAFLQTGSGTVDIGGRGIGFGSGAISKRLAEGEARKRRESFINSLSKPAQNVIRSMDKLDDYVKKTKGLDPSRTKVQIVPFVEAESGAGAKFQKVGDQAIISLNAERITPGDVEALTDHEVGHILLFGNDGESGVLSVQDKDKILSNAVKFKNSGGVSDDVVNTYREVYADQLSRSGLEGEALEAKLDKLINIELVNKWLESPEFQNMKANSPMADVVKKVVNWMKGLFGQKGEAVDVDFEDAKRIIQKVYRNYRKGKIKAEVGIETDQPSTTTDIDLLATEPVPKPDQFGPRHSLVTPEQDARYTELAQNPETNQAELQKMVDEEAKKAGYNVGPVYHGTFKGADFTEFKESKSGVVGRGIYVTPFDGDAMAYGEKVYPLYIKMENPMTVEYSDIPMAVDMRKRAEMLGHDGIIIQSKLRGEDFSEASVFSPEQLTSAAPVTRDDAGNVIPLSERFQVESPDIRYSLAETGEWERQQQVRNLQRQLRNLDASIAEEGESKLNQTLREKIQQEIKTLKKKGPSAKKLLGESEPPRYRISFKQWYTDQARATRGGEKAGAKRATANLQGFIKDLTDYLREIKAPANVKGRVLQGINNLAKASGFSKDQTKRVEVFGDLINRADWLLARHDFSMARDALLKTIKETNVSKLPSDYQAAVRPVVESIPKLVREGGTPVNGLDQLADKITEVEGEKAVDKNMVANIKASRGVPFNDLLPTEIESIRDAVKLLATRSSQQKKIVHEGRQIEKKELKKELRKYGKVLGSLIPSKKPGQDPLGRKRNIAKNLMYSAQFLPRNMAKLIDGKTEGGVMTMFLVDSLDAAEDLSVRTRKTFDSAYHNRVRNNGATPQDPSVITKSDYLVNTHAIISASDAKGENGAAKMIDEMVGKTKRFNVTFDNGSEARLTPALAQSVYAFAKQKGQSLTDLYRYLNEIAPVMDEMIELRALGDDATSEQIGRYLELAKISDGWTDGLKFLTSQGGFAFDTVMADEKQYGKSVYRDQQLSINDISRIIGQLTPDDVAFVDAIHDTINNEIHDVMFQKFEEENGYPPESVNGPYMPQSRLNYFMKKDKDGSTQPELAESNPYNQRTMNGWGHFKARSKHATSIAYIKDIYKIFDEHSRFAANYVGYVTSLRQVNEFLADREVEGIISDYFGQALFNDIKEKVATIQGGAQDTSNPLDGLAGQARAHFAKSVLPFSILGAIPKQVMSYGWSLRHTAPNLKQRLTILSTGLPQIVRRALSPGGWLTKYESSALRALDDHNGQIASRRASGYANKNIADIAYSSESLFTHTGKTAMDIKLFAAIRKTDRATVTQIALDGFNRAREEFGISKNDFRKGKITEAQNKELLDRAAKIVLTAYKAGQPMTAAKDNPRIADWKGVGQFISNFRSPQISAFGEIIDISLDGRINAVNAETKVGKTASWVRMAEDMVSPLVFMSIVSMTLKRARQALAHRNEFPEDDEEDDGNMVIGLIKELGAEIWGNVTRLELFTSLILGGVTYQAQRAKAGKRVQWDKIVQIPVLEQSGNIVEIVGRTIVLLGDISGAEWLSEKEKEYYIDNILYRLPQGLGFFLALPVKAVWKDIPMYIKGGREYKLEEVEKLNRRIKLLNEAFRKEVKEDDGMKNQRSEKLRNESEEKDNDDIKELMKSLNDVTDNPEQLAAFADEDVLEDERANELPLGVNSDDVKKKANELLKIKKKMNELASLFNIRKEGLVPDARKGQITTAKGSVYLVDGSTSTVLSKDKMERILVEKLKMSPAAAQVVLKKGMTPRFINPYLKVVPRDNETMMDIQREERV